MDRPSPELVQCPYCGEKNPAIEDDCQVCNKPLAFFLGPQQKMRRVNLATVMILIAMMAVCLGIGRESPFLGIFLAIVLLPAVVRSVLAVAERRADSRPMNWEEKIDVFVSAAGASLLIGLAAGASFAATSLLIGIVGIIFVPQPRAMTIIPIAAISGGIAASIGMVVFLSRLFWPRND